jgi:ubiquinone/menaquinone biosynthesis C-methylase UbiE
MTRDDYRRIAPWYDFLIDPFNKALRPIGYRLFRVRAGMRVLEVGCGTGAQLAYYRERGCRAMGVDLSAAMLVVARSRLGAEAAVCRADGDRLPFPDGVFDRVLATLVLHEMAPAARPRVLEEMARVLHPAGYIGIIDYHPESEPSLKGFLAKGFIGLIERAAGRNHFRHYRHFIADGGILALAQHKGLRKAGVKRVSGGNIGLYRLGRQE